MVRTGQRSLYYVLGNGRAVRYPVGVGRSGKQWAGTTRIDGKYSAAWSPPAEVKRDRPSMPNVMRRHRATHGRRDHAEPVANTRSTAPTRRARSEASSPMAASGC